MKCDKSPPLHDAVGRLGSYAHEVVASDVGSIAIAGTSVTACQSSSKAVETACPDLKETRFVLEAEM